MMGVNCMRVVDSHDGGELNDGGEFCGGGELIMDGLEEAPVSWAETCSLK